MWNVVSEEKHNIHLNVDYLDQVNAGKREKQGIDQEKVPLQQHEKFPIVYQELDPQRDLNAWLPLQTLKSKI